MKCLLSLFFCSEVDNIIDKNGILFCFNNHVLVTV